MFLNMFIQICGRYMSFLSAFLVILLPWYVSFEETSLVNIK